MPTFQPPTYEAGIPTKEKPLCFFRYTYANSVVRIGGVLTSVTSPSADQLAAAGKEGVDYFIGGHIYTVTTATANELIAAGFSVT